MTLLLASIAPPIASFLSFFVEAHRDIIIANSMSINFLTLNFAHALLGKLGIEREMCPWDISKVFW
jgi:hypothetical protein